MFSPYTLIMEIYDIYCNIREITDNVRHCATKNDAIYFGCYMAFTKGENRIHLPKTKSNHQCKA